jgi:two-component system response regulator (stage 0 sporulation protein A)
LTRGFALLPTVAFGKIKKEIQNIIFFMKEKKKVLVVEDEKSLRDIFVDFLRRETDWEIYEAGDGEEALALARVHVPDVVVLDLLMPKMNGITLMKKIEEEKISEKIKIIFLTNSGELSAISAVSSPSVVGYFVKSNIDMREVLERIKEAFE